MEEAPSRVGTAAGRLSRVSLGVVGLAVRHRDLLRQMVVRDLTARFAGTSIGALWSLIHPLILLGLYTFVFSYIYRVRLQVAEGVGFIPFVFCGLWPWMAFHEACVRSVGVIVDNGHLVKRVRFPSELLVVSVILSSFLSQAVGFVLFLLALSVWKGNVPLLHLFLLAFPFGVHITFAVGIGLLLATANVFLRDVGQLAGAAFTIWFFLTPVLYPLQMVPEGLRPVLAWNPLTALLALYRGLILGSGAEWSLVIFPLAVSLLLLSVAQWVFQRSKGYFADYL